MIPVEELRRLNTDKNRTDGENLLLKEMVEEDRDDLLRESTDIDYVIPGDGTPGLFGDSTSGGFEDTLDRDSGFDPVLVNSNDILSGFSMKEIF